MPPYRLRLILLIVLFVCGAWGGALVMPPFEGGDEWLQMAYIERLRTTGQLPDRTDTQSPVRQQAGQPPLTYALSALPAMALRLPPVDTVALWDDLQASSNNWFAPPDRFNRADNNNVFYTSNAPANDPALVRWNLAARLIAPLWGVMAILAVYAAGVEMFGRRDAALMAAALLALTPTYVHVHSFPNSDAGAAALGAVVTWLCVQGVRRGLSVRWALLTGTVLGLAGLVKVSALLVGVGVAVVILVANRRIPDGQKPVPTQDHKPSRDAQKGVREDETPHIVGTLNATSLPDAAQSNTTGTQHAVSLRSQVRRFVLLGVCVTIPVLL
ncbi:MAG: glycosyltransferase family 39 protein, partial [Chloroflexota bacterium]